MTFYADLSPCGYFEADVDFMAIGWLEADHGFTKGPVSDEFRMALANFIPFSRWFFCGLHQCSLCHDAYGGVGGFVPSENRLFAFPELLAHYVEIHGYQPPAEFQEALQRCPPTTSDEYFDELARMGMVVPEDERIAFREFVSSPGPEDYLKRLEISDHDSEDQLLEVLQLNVPRKIFCQVMNDRILWDADRIIISPKHSEALEKRVWESQFPGDRVNQQMLFESARTKFLAEGLH